MSKPISPPKVIRLMAVLAVVLQVAFVAVATMPAIAQEQAAVLQAPDYAAWSLVGDRAERSIADGRASTAAFEDLRRTLVDWRGQFQDAQGANAQRIATAEAQLAALGPAPAEDETETPEIARLRDGLNVQLAQLRAPGIRAVEALNRATGLISQVDALIADRDANRLLNLGTSPLRPGIWADAYGALGSSLGAVSEEIRLASASETQRQKLSSNLPAIGALLALSFILLTQLRGRVSQIGRQWLAEASPAGARLGRFAQDAVGLGASVGGILALAQALRLTSYLGFRGIVLLDAIQAAAITFVVARWLAPRLVPPTAQLAHGPALAHAAGWVALAFGASGIITGFAQYDRYMDDMLAVLRFPIILVAAFGLFGLARAAKAAIASVDRPASQEPGFRDNVQRILIFATRLVAILAPIGAAIGYGYAGFSLVFATAQTLALFACLIVVAALIRDLYGAFRGKDDADLQASLTPVVANLVLVLAAAPILALIWGVRQARLSDIWTTVGEGMRIGDSQITPADFLTFAIVFAVGYLITRALQSTLKNSVLPKTGIEAGAQNSLTSGIGYVGIFAAAVIAISSAGIDLSSLAIVAGALSVGIGFGLQNIVSNFVSGIILLIERPISEGDWIEVGGQQGYVRDISVRSTRIETFDRSDVIVPNSDLVSGQVTNFTRGNSIGRVIVPVAVAYGTDTRRVETILRDIAEAHPMVVLNPPPSIVFQNFGADGLDFEIRAILRDVNWVLSVKSDLNHEIMKRFSQENIEIPFAQRDIWLRNADQLVAALGQNAKGSA